MPQGLVLKPGLFSDYSSLVASLIRLHGISAHCYVNDTQLYVALNMSEEDVMLKKLEKCTEDLGLWMNENHLKLNDSKTKFMILGSTYMLMQILTTSIQVGEECISATTIVCNSGAYF